MYRRRIGLIPEFYRETRARQGAVLSILLIVCWLILVLAAETLSSGTESSAVLYILCNSLSLFVVLVVAYAKADPLHPVSFFAITNFIYSGAYPIGTFSAHAMFPLPTVVLIDGLRIFSFGTLALCVASFFVCFSTSSSSTPSKEVRNRPPRDLLIAGAILLSFSFAVILYYSLTLGSSAGGSYLDRLDATKELSVLGFAIYMPLCSLALALVARAQNNYIFSSLLIFGSLVALALATLLLLHRSLVVRALLIFIVFVHYKWRAIKLSEFLLAICGGVFVFMIIGYVRRFANVDITIVEMIMKVDFDDLTDLTVHGEFKEIFKTALAAWRGVVAPLPYAEDYLFSWQFAIPRALIGDSRMVPLNVRYAILQDPNFALRGGGLGFSLAAEAYIVFGLMGVFIVYTLILAFFCKLYSWSRRVGHVGVPFYIYLISFFSIAWVQRNSFAYFIREPLFYSIAIPLCLVFFFHFLFQSVHQNSSHSHGAAMKLRRRA